MAFTHFLLLTLCFLVWKAEEVLQKYLKSKEDTTNTILQTDQTLTEKEKEIEGKKSGGLMTSKALKSLHGLSKSGILKLEQVKQSCNLFSNAISNNK